MTSPDEGFQYDGDKVSARLSVDIPQEAIRSLDDVAQRTEDLRVNMEAVAKATADYSEYIQSIPALGEEAESRQGSFIQRNVDRLAGYEPSGLPAWQTAQGNEQLQNLANNDPRQFANVMAQRGQDPDFDAEDTSRVIDRGLGPMPAPRSRRQSGDSSNRGPSRGDDSGPSNRDDSSTSSSASSKDIDWLDVLRENQDRTVGTITSVLGEISLGGRANALQMTSNIANRFAPGLQNIQGQAAQEVASIEQENNQLIEQYASENGVSVADAAEALRAGGALRGTGAASALGGGAGMLLKGAGVAGLAAAGFAGVQKVGSTMQGFAAQGAQRGGGMQEGLQFEMGVRSMAMNPFIDVEQSRKIMQTALNEGFTGNEMETVTQFMTENLMKMNMTAQESAKVLQENVIKGGQDMAEAQQDAMAASNLAQNEDAKKTSSEFRDTWQDSTATAIAAGADGSAASSLGGLASSMFGESEVLGSLSGQIVPGMTTNMSMGMAIGQEVGYRGNPLGALEYALNQKGGDKTVMRVWAQKITEIARQVSPMVANEQTKYTGIENFRMRVQSMTGVRLEDHRQAEELYHMAADGSLMAEIDRAGAEQEKALGGGEVTEKSAAEGMVSGGAVIKDSVKYGASAITLGIGNIFGGDNWLANESREDMAEASGDIRRNWEGAKMGAASNYRIDQLMEEYGAGNIRVKNGQGKEEKFDITNKEMMDAIASGKSKISADGGAWQTLQDMNLQEGMGEGVGSTQKFDLTEDAKKLLRLVPDDPRSQHQKNFDSNTPGVTANKPPAGESFGVGGR